MRFHAAALQIAVRLGLGHAAGGLQQRLGVPDDLLILLGGFGGRARLLLIGARHGIHSALLVSSSSGLRSHEDFEPAPADDAPPWVARRLRDMQGREWLQLDPARLLAQPTFLDAGLE